MSFAIDSDFVHGCLARLVQIESVNPTLDPRGSGEAEIAAYVGAEMDDLGLAVETFEPEPGRVSVLGTLPGKGRGRALMLNAHLDTVGVDEMATPFSATVSEGRLHGRGAYDMKGSMAACLGAVKAIVDGGVSLRGDLVIAGVADEEYSSLGTTDILERIEVEGAIVTEPTHLRVCLAHKGYVWLRVRTVGRAAHGSRFEEGIDANVHMGKVLSELGSLSEILCSGRPHPLVGPPSIHAPLLRGGTGISTYAASSEAQIERRTIPGETAEQVEWEIQEILDRLSALDATFDASMETFFVREPFEVDPQAEIVRAVDGAVRAVTDRDPQHVGDTPWMDAALLANAGVDTVVIGPAGGGAHSPDEWVDLESVDRLAAILARAAVEYCGPAPKRTRRRKKKS